MMPSHADVLKVMSDHPERMVHDCASAVINSNGLTEVDLLWLMTAYELNKPKVHSVTVSEGIRTMERLG